MIPGDGGELGVAKEQIAKIHKNHLENHLPRNAETYESKSFAIEICF